jgi:iron complex transport system ATP-binding protein
MNPAILGNELRLAYTGHEALKGVSLQVERGEFFAIIGPNGSGKTTLLRSLAGTISPDRGTIRILGRDLQEYTRRDLARNVALVPQLPDQDFTFTVREVVLMGRSPHLGLLGLESGRDQDIARRSMEATRIEHLAQRRMHQLSGGEKQRVMIARALAQDPQIMLLDEPTSSLDLAHQIRIMDLLERLKKELGITVVMVAHDLNLAALYGDRLLLLRDGRAEHTGPPSEVLTFDNLERAFGCVLLVDESPVEGLPRVNIIPGRHLDRDLMQNT